MFSSQKMYALTLLAITLMTAGCATSAAANHAKARESTVQRARLGAGDELGEAIFNRYVAMVRAGDAASALRQAHVQPAQTPQPPTAAARMPVLTADRWLMLVHVPGWVLRLGGVGPDGELTVLPTPLQPPPSDQLLAG